MLGVQDCGFSMKYGAEEMLALKERGTESSLRGTRDVLSSRPCVCSWKHMEG